MGGDLCVGGVRFQSRPADWVLFLGADSAASNISDSVRRVSRSIANNPQNDDRFHHPGQPENPVTMTAGRASPTPDP